MPSRPGTPGVSVLLADSSCRASLRARNLSSTPAPFGPTPPSILDFLLSLSAFRIRVLSLRCDPVLRFVRPLRVVSRGFECLVGLGRFRNGFFVINPELFLLALEDRGVEAFHSEYFGFSI